MPIGVKSGKRMGGIETAFKIGAESHDKFALNFKGDANV